MNECFSLRNPSRSHWMSQSFSYQTSLSLRGQHSFTLASRSAECSSLFPSLTEVCICSICHQALHAYRKKFNSLPNSYNREDAKHFLDIVRQVNKEAAAKVEAQPRPLCSCYVQTCTCRSLSVLLGGGGGRVTDDEACLPCEGRLLSNAVRDRVFCSTRSDEGIGIAF